MEGLRSEGLVTVQLDLDDSRSIASALAETLRLTGGRLDARFNNGTYGQPGAVEDLSRDARRAQLETNLLGWHDLTCRVIPVMRRQGFGRIVQNSSILGLIALPHRGAHAASKFTLAGLTDTLRLELRGSETQDSLIEPGPGLAPRSGLQGWGRISIRPMDPKEGARRFAPVPTNVRAGASWSGG